jgi:hypothetical protein
MGFRAIGGTWKSFRVPGWVSVLFEGLGGASEILEELQSPLRVFDGLQSSWRGLEDL